MNQTFLVLIASAVLLGNACKSSSASKEAPKSSDQSALSEGVAGAEHCVGAEKNLCFLEVEESGKSTFYAAESVHQNLTLDPGVTAMNLGLKKISDAAYAARVKGSLAPKVTYGAQIDIFENKDASVDDSANRRLKAKKGLFRRGFGAIGSIFNVVTTLSTLASYADLFAPLLKAVNGRPSSLKSLPVSYHAGGEVIVDEISKPNAG